MISRPGLRTKMLKLGSQVTSRPHSQWGRAGINCGSHWHLVYTVKHSSPLRLLNGFLGIFTHCKFSPDSFSLINQHCTLETKAYKVESTWIQSLALFCKHAFWSLYLEHAQRKDGNQQNRTKTCWCQGMLSFCSDVLPNIICRAKNHLILFIYRIILCTQAYKFFSIKKLWNNVGHVSKAFFQGYERTLQTCPLVLLTNLTWPFQRSVQSLSRVRLFATPWIATHRASLSITNSRSSLRLTSIESVMPSRHLILFRPLLLLPLSLPASESFSMSQLFTWGDQSTGVSASASFPPKKSQDWSPSEWTGWISL